MSPCTVELIFSIVSQFLVFSFLRIEIPDDRPSTYIQALQATCRPETEFVVCVLKSSRRDCYDAIKKYLCVENASECKL